MKENSIEEDLKILEEILHKGYTMSVLHPNTNIRESEIRAIEHILSDYKRILKKNENLKQLLDLTDLQSLDIVLSMIEKKDKMIERMTYYIMNLDIDEDICQKVNCDTNSGELDCKDCIKQYFENEAKEVQ